MLLGVGLLLFCLVRVYCYEEKPNQTKQ
jgi:hypothetical protein